MGKGGGSKKNYDPVYNARMAKVAESELAMAKVMYAFWETNLAPLEANIAEMDIRLLPQQERLQSSLLAQEQTLVDTDTEAMRTSAEMQTASNRYEMERMHEARGLLGAEVGAAAAALTADTAASNLKTQSAAAQAELLPQRTEYASNLMTQNTAALQAMRDRADVNLEERMGEASTDVAQEFGKARQQLSRGAVPYRRGAAAQNLAAEEAKARIQAKNQARRQGRKDEAANYAALAAQTKSTAGGLS